ncbi:hypothetical protein V6N11_062192 [Hibiscus sabdariffa]|uniref:Uncharacterized protein n=1 Tax=Hibiscus sabdariffa TaxID=183260 RepID=A0ABR2PS13_9ROSI
MITASQKIATNPDPATLATSSISSRINLLTMRLGLLEPFLSDIDSKDGYPKGEECILQSKISEYSREFRGASEGLSKEYSRSGISFGRKDTSVDKVSWANKLEQQYRKAESKLEGSSESSSEQDCGTHVVEDEHSDGLEKDAINDLLFGKDLAVNMGKDLGNPDRHIGESDLVGDFYCRDASNSGGGIVERTISGVKTRETATLRVGGDRVEVMDPNNASNSPHQIDLEIPSLKAFEDIHNMGMSHGSEDRGLVVSMEEQTINNQAQDVLVDGSRLGVSEDVENGASFFPEMDYAKQCGKLK